VTANRFPNGLAVLGLVVLALALTGCGRKGGLDPPPSAAAPAAATPTARRTPGPGDIFGVQPAEEEAPRAAEGQKRRIILDDLLN
jgi:predicted small lipoprotein YifL